MEEPNDIAGKVEITAADLIHRLREAVQPEGRKGLWLRHLNDKQLAEVYHRLRSGQTLHRVVTVVQRDWGIMKTSEVKSLARGLKKFKLKVLGLFQQATNAKDKEANRPLTKRARKIVEHLDAMERYRWLIDVQTERIETYLGREANLLPMKQTAIEMQLLSGMLDKYLTFAIRLGILSEKPSEFNLNIKHKFDKFVGGLSDGGSRVVQAAHRFLELAEKSAIRMELDPETGRYKPVEKVPSSGPDLLDEIARKALEKGDED